MTHNRNTICIFLALLAVFLLGINNRPAYGDSCVGHSATPGISQNTCYRVYGWYDRSRGDSAVWEYYVQDTESSVIAHGQLPEIPSHAHLAFFISNDGTRFAVLNKSAGHQLDGRLLIYSRDGQLVKSFSMSELLTNDEQKTIVYTISHLNWLRFDSAGRHQWIQDEHDIIELYSQTGRPIRISLQNAALESGTQACSQDSAPACATPVN